MKYRNKKYKWFKVLFVDDKPDGVELFKNCPWQYRGEEGKITTYWENKNLTDKPNI